MPQSNIVLPVPRSPMIHARWLSRLPRHCWKSVSSKIQRHESSSRPSLAFVYIYAYRGTSIVHDHETSCFWTRMNEYTRITPKPPSKFRNGFRSSYKTIKVNSCQIQLLISQKIRSPSDTMTTPSHLIHHGVPSILLSGINQAPFRATALT
jgi:hypothetical protein